MLVSDVDVLIVVVKLTLMLELVVTGSEGALVTDIVGPGTEVVVLVLGNSLADDGVANDEELEEVVELPGEVVVVITGGRVEVLVLVDELKLEVELDVVLADSLLVAEEVEGETEVVVVLGT